MSDVTIKYNNQTIAELDESCSAVLNTTQKKCSGDIEVEYSKPEGGKSYSIDIYTRTDPNSFNMLTLSGQLRVAQVGSFRDVWLTNLPKNWYVVDATLINTDERIEIDRIPMYIGMESIGFIVPDFNLFERNGVYPDAICALIEGPQVDE